MPSTSTNVSPALVPEGTSTCFTLEAPDPECTAPTNDTGLAGTDTDTSCETESLAPPSSVTVNVTVYDPDATNT